MDVGKYRNPELAAARAKLDAEKAAYREVVTKVQAECPHPVAVEMKGYSGMLGPFNARRICPACGYEEECGGTMWCWGGIVSVNCEAVADGERYSFQSKLKTDFVHQVSSDSAKPFYRSRP